MVALVYFLLSILVFFLYLCATPFGLQRLLSKNGATTTAQAIVVLGNKEPDIVSRFKHETSFSLIAATSRIDSAVQIHQQTQLPLLLSGGQTEIERSSEAQQMQNHLRTKQIQAKWLEEESSTTWENALFCAKILKQEKIQSIIICTHPWHFPRAAYCFRRFGIQASLYFNALPNDAIENEMAPFFVKHRPLTKAFKISLFNSYLLFLIMRERIAILAYGLVKPKCGS